MQQMLPVSQLSCNFLKFRKKVNVKGPDCARETERNRGFQNKLTQQVEQEVQVKSYILLPINVFNLNIKRDSSGHFDINEEQVDTDSSELAQCALTPVS